MWSHPHHHVKGRELGRGWVPGGVPLLLHPFLSTQPRLCCAPATAMTAAQGMGRSERKSSPAGTW